MLTITPGAAEQIRRGAGEAGGAAPLRVAAKRLDDGSIDYGMGFDEWRSGDLRILSQGVAVVVAPASRELLKDVTIDYVEVGPGDLRFVFVAAGPKQGVKEEAER